MDVKLILTLQEEAFTKEASDCQVRIRHEHLICVHMKMKLAMSFPKFYSASIPIIRERRK